LQARKLEVDLLNTEGEEDILINDVLVSEGHAEYKTKRRVAPPQPKKVTVLEQLMKFTFK